MRNFKLIHTRQLGWDETICKEAFGGCSHSKNKETFDKYVCEIKTLSNRGIIESENPVGEIKILGTIQMSPPLKENT